MQNTSKHKCVGSVILIPCENIDPSPLHCRQTFKGESFDELVVSVKKYGIIQPLLVKKICSRYQIISGERRLRAAILAGFIYVPCIITDLSDLSYNNFSFIENKLHEDIHFFDEAFYFSEVLKKTNVTVKYLSDKIGKSEEYIYNKISLLNLDSDIRKSIIDFSLSEEKSRMLLRINDVDKQKKMIDCFINNKICENTINNFSLNTIIGSLSNTKRVLKFNNLNLFINTFNHTVDTMQKAGINVVSEQYESENFLEYVVRIPKITTSPVI